MDVNLSLVFSFSLRFFFNFGQKGDSMGRNVSKSVLYCLFPV